MKAFKTEFGIQQELKVNPKDLAIELMIARTKITEIWLDNKPETEEEKAIWIRLGIAIEQIGESANMLTKQK